MIPRILAAALLPALLAACSKPAEPPRDLASAVAVVGYLASPRFVNMSAWSSVAEKGTPSEFVSYLFSDIGAAELPEPVRPGDPAGSGRGGPPGWPEGIALRSMRPDPRAGKQVGVSPVAPWNASRIVSMSWPPRFVISAWSDASSCSSSSSAMPEVPDGSAPCREMSMRSNRSFLPASQDRPRPVMVSLP